MPLFLGSLGTLCPGQLKPHHAPGDFARQSLSCPCVGFDTVAATQADQHGHRVGVTTSTPGMPGGLVQSDTKRKRQVGTFTSWLMHESPMGVISVLKGAVLLQASDPRIEVRRQQAQGRYASLTNYLAYSKPSCKNRTKRDCLQEVHPQGSRVSSRRVRSKRAQVSMQNKGQELPALLGIMAVAGQAKDPCLLPLSRLHLHMTGLTA